MYEQEVTETKKRKQVELSEIDGRLQSEYEAKLADALRELREQYEEQLLNNRNEIEVLYETKVSLGEQGWLEYIIISYSWWKLTILLSTNDEVML